MHDKVLVIVVLIYRLRSVLLVMHTRTHSMIIEEIPLACTNKITFHFDKVNYAKTVSIEVSVYLLNRNLFFSQKRKKSLFIGSACYICHWYTRLNKNYGKNKRIEKIQNERQYFDIAYSICYWCVFFLSVLLHILFFSVCLFPHPFEVHNNRRL